MIKFINVSKTFQGQTIALDSVNLEIQPKEFVSIIGVSGSGKTTLVRLLIADERVDHGQVIVGGWDITRIRQHEIPYLRRQIGVVFQDYKLLDKKTVFENVAFAMQVCGASISRIRKIVPSVLKIVGLDDKHTRYPKQLSGGEQQRVAIARALVHGPKIFLADEPTGNLDAINAKEILEILTKINQIGITVLLVTHDEKLVNWLNRRVVVLSNRGVISDKSHGKYNLENA